MIERLAATCLMLLSVLTGSTLVRAEEPAGQLAISPGIVELSIDSKPAIGSIRLQNLKNEPVKVKLSVYNWTLDEQNNVKLIPGSPQSLDQWLLISPLSFTLEPGGCQVIRYSVRPNVQPEPGEHRALLSISEEDSGNESWKEGIRLKFNYSMAMYGYCGSTHESAEIESLLLDRHAGAIRAVVRNNGNMHTRLTGDYTLWKAGTFPGFKAMKEYLRNSTEWRKPEGLIASGSIFSMPVLPGHRRTITESLGVSGQKSGYVVAFNGKLGGRQIERLFQ
ncbi:MAG: molecular chaperone [Chlorobiaceae bacterium]|nr:molecular chaperone [Chlorobiaceae bacterium]